MTVRGEQAAAARRALAGITAELEARWGGGSPFFDALDERLRDSFWFRVLVERYLDEFPSRPDIAVSGRWGRSFAAWYRRSEWRRYGGDVLPFPGELRHRALAPLEIDLTGRTLVLLDDSTYRGRTRDKIYGAIRAAGGRTLKSIVAYDGSREPPQAMSVFRYHPISGYRP